jgi:NAD(P)H-nitrite reductase large subunit
MTVSRQRLVVVGNGMIGMRTVEEALKRAPGRYDITVFGAEPHPNYNRILLSSVLAGEKTLEEIVTHPLPWYEERGVALAMGDPSSASIRRPRRSCRRSGARSLTIAWFWPRGRGRSRRRSRASTCPASAPFGTSPISGP